MDRACRLSCLTGTNGRWELLKKNALAPESPWHGRVLRISGLESRKPEAEPCFGFATLEPCQALELRLRSGRRAEVSLAAAAAWHCVWEFLAMAGKFFPNSCFHVAVGQNQWYHFEVGAPSFLPSWQRGGKRHAWLSHAFPSLYLGRTVARLLAIGFHVSADVDMALEQMPIMLL